MRRRQGRTVRKAPPNSTTKQSTNETPAAATSTAAGSAVVGKVSSARRHGDSLPRSQAAAAAAAAGSATSGTKRSSSSSSPPRVEEEEVGRNSFLFTRRVFLHLLGLIYFTAFLVAWHQNEALIGPGGLTPAKTHMVNLARRFLGKSGNSWADNFEGFCQRPTLLWFVPFEQFYSALDFITVGGVGLSALLMVFGRANGVVLFLLWVFYFSIDTVGQRWYGFGWESQLLETGFLAIFSVPFLQLSSLEEASAPLGVVVWGNRWLMFRLMIGAGLIKLRGDQCWHDLTCMDYHYETQPVPSPVSWFLHFNAGWFHKVETMTNHIVECVVPFFVFMPRNWRVACGVLQIGFQIVLIVSGNLSFLNWLSILPSLWCLDDAFFHSIGWVSKHNLMAIAHHEDDEKISRGFLAALGRTVRMVTSLCLLIGLTYLSVPVVANLLQLHGRQAMNTNYNNFKLLNTYGAFGSIGKERTEVILQGTRDDIHGPGPVEWMDYEFKCKPGDIDRTPCIITPYHYRLDWLLWFCAFSDYKTYPWLLHLADKLMVNDPLMSSMLAEGGNPFLDGEPPRYVRALHYSYKLSPPADAENFFAALATKKSMQELFSSLRQSFARQALRMLYFIADAVGIERERSLDLSTSPGTPAEPNPSNPVSQAGAQLVAEGYEVGRWWSRKLLGEYFPAVSRENASLRKFLQKHGWGSE